MTLAPDSPLATLWCPSPNHELRRDGRAPDMLILHYTGMDSAEAALDWLTREESKVSAHYLIDEEGRNISAGEQQLLTIARAFLATPPLLLLDEATRSVDTRTEVLVQHAMAALRSDRTSFVIAHRLSTIRDADVILVMEHGAIVEHGSHTELLAKRGHYYALYNSQFSEAITEERVVAPAA